MAFVGRVPVPVVDVVGVVLVWHGHMAAVLSVLVGVPLVRHVLRDRALVDVIVVGAVDVALVRVIGVIAVRHRDVAAALAVDVLMTGVRVVLDGVWHDILPVFSLT
jgi:hypothetical protein